MRTMRRAVVAGALVMIAVAAASGCGKKSTNPIPPPGGSSELNSPVLTSGSTWVHTFANGGIYGYHCSIHPSMTGSVSVAAGGADSAVVDIQNFQFSPASVTIAPGKYVRWVNNSGSHTVTSH